MSINKNAEGRKKMGRIYDYIRKEKWPLVLGSTMILGAGTMVNGIYNITSIKPENYAVTRYLKIEHEFNQRVNLKDLLNPSFRDSLEATLQELENERSNLRSLPNFENEMKKYEEKLEKTSKKGGDKMMAGVILATLSFVGCGLIAFKRLLKRVKSK